MPKYKVSFSYPTHDWETGYVYVEAEDEADAEDRAEDLIFEYDYDIDNIEEVDP